MTEFQLAILSALATSGYKEALNIFAIKFRTNNEFSQIFTTLITRVRQSSNIIQQSEIDKLDNSHESYLLILQIMERTTGSDYPVYVYKDIAASFCIYILRLRVIKRISRDNSNEAYRVIDDITNPARELLYSYIVGIHTYYANNTAQLHELDRF